MRDFDFFKFMWVRYIPVFDNTNQLSVPTILTDDNGVPLTDENGVLLTDGTLTLNSGDRYRYI